MTYARKVDHSQADIVKGLRDAGYWVEGIRRPVDLLVGLKKVNIYDDEGFSPIWRWTLLEVKTPTKTGKRRSRTDQALQDQFIKETGTAVVTTLEEALKALKWL